MNFSDIISAITSPAISFAQSNPLIAIAIAAFLAFLIYRKPLFFLIMLLITLLVLGALYVILSASSSGVSVKERMIQEGGTPQNISKPSGLLF
jgi:Ca2+/Na+ antiporter